MSNPKSSYVGVKLPKEMVVGCETIIENHPECRWTSVADFVRDAIRHYEYWKNYVFSAK